MPRTPSYFKCPPRTARWLAAGLLGLALTSHAVAQPSEKRDVTVQTPEGCAAVIGASDKPANSPKAVVIGRCKNGKVDGHALLLRRYGAEDILTAIEFVDGSPSGGLYEEIRVRANDSSSFKHRIDAKEQVQDFRTADAALRQWRRFVREYPGWNTRLRLPGTWSEIRALLDRHGRPYLPGEVVPAGAAARINGDFWPKGWQAIGAEPKK